MGYSLFAWSYANHVKLEWLQRGQYFYYKALHTLIPISTLVIAFAFLKLCEYATTNSIFNKATL